MALNLIGGNKKGSKLLFMIKALIIKGFPKLGLDILKLSIVDDECVQFFANIMRKTLKQRLEGGQKRNDLIDLILHEIEKSKKNGGIKKEVEESEFEKNASVDTSDVKDMKNFDIERMLIANAVGFFFAGFETSATGMSLVCHKLCLYPELQERVREEILDVLGDDGEITFEKLNEMKYLDMFISESLRATLIGHLERMCTKNYKVPGTDLVIPKGKQT